jgi:hypothetical protein
MGDGGEVVTALKLKAKTDPRLLKAMLYDKSRYCDPKWAGDVLAELGKTRFDFYYL